MLIKENYSKQEKLVTGAYRRLLRYSIWGEKIIGEFPSLDANCCPKKKKHKKRINVYTDEL